MPPPPLLLPLLPTPGHSMKVSSVFVSVHNNDNKNSIDNRLTKSLRTIGPVDENISTPCRSRMCCGRAGYWENARIDHSVSKCKRRSKVNAARLARYQYHDPRCSKRVTGCDGSGDDAGDPEAEA